MSLTIGSIVGVIISALLGAILWVLREDRRHIMSSMEQMREEISAVYHKLLELEVNLTERIAKSETRINFLESNRRGRV